MANTTCPHCNGGLFQVKTKEPAGSKFKINFVQCSGCGAPVGVLDFFNTGAQLSGIDDTLSRMEKRLKHVEGIVAAIANAMR